MSDYLSYRLGYSIGEQIVYKFLPTLNIETPHPNGIDVSKEEADEYHRLDETWYKKYQNNKEESEKNFKQYRKYAHKLIKKYLPKEVECWFEYIDTSKLNLREFKQGINNSLWNSDISNYLIKKENWIKSDSHSLVTHIIISLDIDEIKD